MEVIVALGILTTGLLAVWGLLDSNYNGEKEAKAQVIGVNLAREGVELVKNMRDSNWLHVDSNKPCFYKGVEIVSCSWDSGLGAGVYSIGNQFAVDDNGNPLLFLDSANLDGKLFITDSGDYAGFYSNASTTGSKYSGYDRLITIKDICCNNAKCTDNAFNDCSVGSNLVKVGLDIEVKVNWKINDKKREAIVQDQIFNWR